jgi:tetratricopeptide (TPR) repeat protein/DNA-binding MarR family transcriptional regulator
MARLVVSQNERLLLHLSELDKHRDDAEVPLAASQEGIAQELQIQVHNASRALSSLQEEGLVFDRLAHVRGAPRRRRAYFLTEKGRQVAQTIRADIAKRKVVLEHAGKVQELPLEEAVRKVALLCGVSLTVLEMVDLARSSDIVRTEGMSRKSATFAAPEFVERSHGRPKVDAFFGRDSERKALSDALVGSEVSAILVWGMPGIGKSTLASKLFDEMSGRKSMFWYSIREWDTDASLLSALTEFLASAGRSEASRAVKRGSPLSDMYVPMFGDLAGSGLVLFFDDVHKASKQVSTVLSVILEAVKASRSGKIILLSRSIPSFFSRTAQGNIGMEVTGLDRDSARRMAQSMSAKDAARVVDESHGHPLLLNLMARGGVGNSKGDVIAFVEREVYSTLPAHERELLELLSVFRHPVTLEAVREVDYNDVAKLRHRALIVEQQDGIWTHDLLREFFSSRLSSARKTALHRIGAEYCEGHTGVEWKLETLYHHVEAGDWSAARRVAVSNAMELAKEFPEETLAFTSRIPKDNASPREYAELLFLRGQMNESLGRQEAALVDFEESILLLSGEEYAEKRALVLEAIAKLQSKIERWSDSLAGHEKALRIYEKSNDREGQGREWMNIGGVHRKRHDFAKARSAYDEALSFAAKAEDRPLQAACLNNLALLDWDEGDLLDAEMKFKESVRLAHAVKDHGGEARGLENLASLYKAQLKLGEMTTVLMESSEAFRRAGEVVEFKRLQAACAAALGDQRRYSEGIEVCQNALERPDLRRSRGLFQKSPRFDSGDVALSSALVDLLRASGDHKMAQKELARYNAIADAMGDQSAKAKGSLMQALLLEDLGNLDDAIKSLSEAEGLLRGAGNSEGLIAVHMRWGIVEEKRGNVEGAARHYEAAARHAELSGNKYAYALALENNQSVKSGTGTS